MSKLKNIALTTLLFVTGCTQNIKSSPIISKRDLSLNNIQYSIQDNQLKQESPQDNPLNFGIVSDIHGEGEKAKKTKTTLHTPM